MDIQINIYSNAIRVTFKWPGYYRNGIYIRNVSKWHSIKLYKTTFKFISTTINEYLWALRAGGSKRESNWKTTPRFR